jgi:hypothetical protein
MESMCCTAALIIHSLLVHEAQTFFTSSSLSLLSAEDNVVQICSVYWYALVTYRTDIVQEMPHVPALSTFFQYLKVATRSVMEGMCIQSNARVMDIQFMNFLPGIVIHVYALMFTKCLMAAALFH